MTEKLLTGTLRLNTNNTWPPEYQSDRKSKRPGGPCYNKSKSILSPYGAWQMSWKRRQFQCIVYSFAEFIISYMSRQQNQQYDMSAQRRRRSTWASAQSDQSFCCPYEETLHGPFTTYWVHSEDSDQTGGCPSWSKFSLGAHIILLVLQWDGPIIINEPGHEKMCVMSYVNNKGADRTAHPHCCMLLR